MSQVHDTLARAGARPSGIAHEEAVRGNGYVKADEQPFREADDSVLRGARRRRNVLIAGDVAALLASSIVMGTVVAVLGDLPLAQALGGSGILAAVSLSLWLGLTAVSGLYRRDDRRTDLTVTDDLAPVVILVSISQWAIFVAATLVGASIPAPLLVGFWIIAIAFLFAGRMIARTYMRERAAYAQNTLIVGAGVVGQLLGRKLTHHPELGLRLVGFVDDDPRSMRRDLVEFPVLGAPADIRNIVKRYDVRRIVIAFSKEGHDRQLEMVHAFRNLDVQIDVVPRLFEAIGPAVGVHYVEGLPLVALQPVRTGPVARAAKRAIDIIGSAALLALLSPLFVYIAWRIPRDSPGPVFFRQERLGQNMEPFELLKFRTMHVDTDDGPHREYVRSIMSTSEAPTDNNLYKLDRSDAVTGFGTWLRRTSLDELPQLVNVLRGEMSLVGPRPCLPYEGELCGPQHLDRFLVPAGMTGLWQVTARARTTFREMLDLDVAYARDWSLGLDIKLLLRTPFVVLRTRGTA